jgi:hypothetical protein
MLVVVVVALITAPLELEGLEVVALDMLELLDQVQTELQILAVAVAVLTTTVQTAALAL